MLKMRVTVVVFGACYVQCNTCAHALQLQTRPSVPRSPRRGRTARRYVNDVEIGSSADHAGARGVPRTAAAPAAAPASSELLTFAEEKEIAAEIRRLRSVTQARDRLSAWPSREVHPGDPSDYQWASSCSLSVDELQDVIARGQEARTRLVTGNVGLVTMIAKRYYQMVRRGAGHAAGDGAGGAEATLRLDDLIQEGHLGIMEAAERYDPTKGFRFSTYATHWIRQRIVRSIAESSRTIRLPVHVQTMVRNMRKKNRELKAQIGRLPSLPELAHEMGVPLDKVRRYQHATRDVLSLENPVDRRAGAEDTRTLGDRVACEELATPEEDFLSEALRGEVRALLAVLGPEERGVLTHRFGLEAAGTPKTLRETAAAMGASIDKVRNTEARALNKLRRPQAHYRLRDYVGGAAAGGDATYAEPPPPQFGHMTVENVGVQNYPQPMHVASWNANDNARDQYLREEHKRHTPESIWSF